MNFINGKWVTAAGSDFDSTDPATGDVIWRGKMSDVLDVDAAFSAARSAFKSWARTPLSERIAITRKYKELAIAHKEEIGLLIAKETGKVLWDAIGEAGALSAKVEISIESYEERTGKKERETAFGRASMRHIPHGVMAVLGPYNFPAHLPNGQIIPALIAGNTVVFKPSEQCPAVGEAIMKLYEAAGFPPGVINMVQGARDTGAAILDNDLLDGVLFTGSANTGAFIHKKFGGRPEIVLALEMGGNNPLVIWDVEDIEAAGSIALQSAFITSGQRCTCARRLIVPDNVFGNALIEKIAEHMDRLTLGSWQDGDAASIGPVISSDIAAYITKSAQAFADRGAKVIRSAELAEQGGAYVKPGLYDVTGLDIPDEEIFGPVLQIIRVESWDEAIDEANNTRFGLSAGLVSDKNELWEAFKQQIRAGVVNFNRPTTGAASFLPFGGPGASGNHNPGAFYAADFCAWPMASQVADKPEIQLLKGMK